MSVTGIVNKVQYAGNDVTTVFAFSNTLYTEAAIAVTLTVDSTGVDTDQANPAEYSVTLAGDFSTASITMATPPATGETLTIYRVQPDTQTLDYVEGGQFPAEAAEIALDKATLESQTQAEQLKRCIKLPETSQDASSGAFDGEMNKPSDINQYIQWNDTLKIYQMVNPITNQTPITVDEPDELMIADASDSFKLRKVTVGDIANLALLIAGSGNVVGPASATNNALSLFDATTGKLLKNSGVLVNNGAMTGITKITTTDGADITGRIKNLGGDVANVIDYGATNDGVDSTAAILTAAAASDLLFIPFNVKYNKTTLLATLPTSVVCFDLSVINDFSSAGETNKSVGIISSDEAVNDTHWTVSSGHHAVVNLNNFGSAGSTSAAERKATLLWSAGQFQLGSTDKRGYRGAVIGQYTKSSGEDFWIWNVRSLAPWLAIDDEYEFWFEGEVITGADVYRSSNDNIYKSQGAGTTGSTAPSVTSGSESDGGVTWDWVDTAGRSVYAFDQHGRWLIGVGSWAQTFYHRVSTTDPDGNYSSDYVARGVSKAAQMKLTPTDGAEALSPQPYLRAQADTGLRIMRSDGSTDIAFFDDTQGFHFRKTSARAETAADADTTPSASGTSTLIVSNTGATNITALDDPSDGQRIRLIFTNANTTLVSSATLLLAGSINVTPSTWSTIDFEKVPTAVSDRWIEVGRSIK